VGSSSTYANSVISCGKASVARSRKLRVWLLDLLPTVPYYTGHLCAALQEQSGVEVSLCVTTYSHDRTFFKRAGLRRRSGLLDLAGHLPTSLRSLRRAGKLVEYIFNLVRLAVHFMFSPPDVVHVEFIPLMNYSLPFETWFLSLARFFGSKLVYTMHNVLPHDTRERHRQAYAKIYHLADRIICHDEHARNRLTAEFNVENDRISVIPHGQLFAKKHQEHHGSTPLTKARDNKCIVLCQGIIRPYKGIPFLLQAWKAARDSGVQASLWIVGTGEEDTLREIERDAVALDLGSSVRFDFRFVSVEELSRYYQDADILVYPYSDVTTSGALMTGIGYGKPIIATDLTAFGQILKHEKNALLAPYGDIAEWASALIKLTSDSHLRARLVRGLQDTQALTPSWAEIASETCRVYEQLVSTRRQFHVAQG
jgi:glycosyltransferase involved in cell wall biosynthesis